MVLFILLSYTIPFDSPIMDNVEYLQLKGFIDIPSIRPYDIVEFVPQLGELLTTEIEFNKIDKKIIQQFNPLLMKSPDFSALGHLKAEYEKMPEILSTFFDARFGGTMGNNIMYAQGIRFRFGSELDTLGTKPWKDIAQAYLTEGFIKFNLQKIKFTIGRQNLFLGPGDEHSLLLSSAPEGYDGFLIQVPGKYYEFHSTFSVLDAADMRFISTHRLGLNLKNFKIGFSEAILWGKEIEPLYLNFFLPYYLEQWGLSRDDNIMWCIDGTFRIFNSVIYGELLIDDYMYEDNPYPNKLAYQGGIKSLLFNNFLVKFNYTYVDKWVYTHKLPINTYEQNGRPLGFPLGNDVDKVMFSTKFLNYCGLCPVLTLSYTRKGQGNIFLPYEQEHGDWNPPFPSGIVEKNFEFNLGLDYNLWSNFYIKTEFGKRFRTNIDHIENNNTDEFLFNLTLWLVL